MTFTRATRTLFDASRSSHAVYLDPEQTIVVAVAVATAMGIEPTDVLPLEIVAKVRADLEEYVK